MDERMQLAMALSISMVDSAAHQNAAIDLPDVVDQAGRGKAKKRGRRKKKTDEDLDEETRLAMAVSASLAVEASQKSRELGKGDEQGRRGKKPKAKGKRKAKKELQEFPVLLTRREEERQIMLQERINAIIATSLEENTSTLHIMQPSRIEKKYSDPETQILTKTYPGNVKIESGAQLWRATGAELAQDWQEQTGDVSHFYVKQLQSTITPQEPRRYTSPRKSSVSATPRKQTPRKALAKTPGRRVSIKSGTTDNGPFPEDTLSTTQALGMTIQCLADLAEEGLVGEEEGLQSLGNTNKTTVASGFIPQDAADQRAESPENQLTEDQLSLLGELSSLVNTPTLSDVTIQIDDGSRLHAHSFIIHLRCPALATLLAKSGGRSSVRAPVIDVSDTCYEAMENILSYLYSANISITNDTAVEISSFAKRYNLPELASHCKAFLKDGADSTKQRKSSQRSELDIVNKDLNQLIDSLWEDEEESKNEKEEEESDVEDGSSENDELKDPLDDDEINEIYEVALTQRSRSRSGSLTPGQGVNDDVEESGSLFSSDGGDASEDGVGVEMDDGGGDSNDADVTITLDDDVEQNSDGKGAAKTRMGQQERKGLRSDGVTHEGIGQGFPDHASSSMEEERVNGLLLTQPWQHPSISDQGDQDVIVSDEDNEDWTLVFDEENMMDTSAPLDEDRSVNSSVGKDDVNKMELSDDDDEGCVLVAMSKPSADRNSDSGTADCRAQGGMKDDDVSPVKFSCGGRMQNSGDKISSPVFERNSHAIQHRLSKDAYQSYTNHERLENHVTTQKSPIKKHRKDGKKGTSKKIKDAVDSQEPLSGCNLRASPKGRGRRLKDSSDVVPYDESNAISSLRRTQEQVLSHRNARQLEVEDDEDTDDILLLHYDSTDRASDSPQRSPGGKMREKQSRQRERVNRNRDADGVVASIGPGGKAVTALTKKFTFKKKTLPWKHQIPAQDSCVHGDQNLHEPYTSSHDYVAEKGVSGANVERSLAVDDRTGFALSPSRTPAVVLTKAKLPDAWDPSRSVEDNLDRSDNASSRRQSSDQTECQAAEDGHFRVDQDLPSHSLHDAEASSVNESLASTSKDKDQHSAEDDFSDDILSPSPPPSPTFTKSQISRLEIGSLSRRSVSPIALDNSLRLGQKRMTMSSIFPGSKSQAPGDQTDPFALSQSSSSSGDAGVQPSSAYSKRRHKKTKHQSFSKSNGSTNSQSKQKTILACSSSKSCPSRSSSEYPDSVTPDVSEVEPVPADAWSPGSSPLPPLSSSPAGSKNEASPTLTPGGSGSGDFAEEVFAYDVDDGGGGFDDFHICGDDEDHAVIDDFQEEERMEMAEDDFSVERPPTSCENGETRLLEYRGNRAGKARGTKDEEDENIQSSRSPHQVGRVEMERAEESIDLTQSESEVEEETDRVMESRLRGSAPPANDDVVQTPHSRGEGIQRELEDEPDIQEHDGTDDLSDSLLLQQFATPSNPSSVKGPILKTPALSRLKQQDEYYSPAAITPMPNFSSMLTPELKKELKRYGVKPLGKKKANLLLTEIFSYLHQVMPGDVSDEETGAATSTTNPLPEAEQAKGRSRKGRSGNNKEKKQTKSTKNQGQSKAKSKDTSTAKEQLQKARPDGENRSVEASKVGSQAPRWKKRKKVDAELDETPTKRVRMELPVDEDFSSNSRTLGVSRGYGVKKVKNSRKRLEVCDDDNNDDDIEGGKSREGGARKGRDELSCSQESHTSTSSYDSGRSDFGESICHLEETEEDDDVMATQQILDLPAEICRFITTNKDLHQKILGYEVLNLDEFLAELKKAKIKCSKNKVMEFLDSRSVTYRHKAGSRQRKPKTTSKPKK